MLHPSKARVISPTRAAADAKQALKAMARPAGAFDARRYFRGSANLRFYNVGTEAVRALAKSIYRAHRDDWSLANAVRFATVLIVDPHLEVKSTGIELLARFRRACTPRLLPVWKRWLANNHASNWATTDAICGYLIGPLILAYPWLAPIVGGWTRHRNMWVRRAAAVSLIPVVRKGAGLDAAYAVARRLHPDREDLIQKAVGWLLREAGKTDPARLEAYLRQHGPSIPRTTVRYAIERMPATTRREVLSATRAPAAMPARKRASAQSSRAPSPRSRSAAR
jgi:3-methyladenine DNA glycosylase AlkD